MSSSFGHLFRIHTWGESHGGGVGVVIDGCPPRIPLDVADIQVELDRRRPGQSRLTTPRQEEDRAEILSGLFEGRTLGTPILIMVHNKDARPEAYEHMRDVYRPSHADYTYEAKYGIRNWQGGGRASARETIGRVAAGAIARQDPAGHHGVGEILAWVSQRAHRRGQVSTRSSVTREQRRSDARRVVPKPEAAEEIDPNASTTARRRGRLARRRRDLRRHTAFPTGLGEPVFDKLEADLAQARSSRCPACKGFEIGSGFAGTRHERHPSTTTPSSCDERTASAPARTAPAACRGESATGSRSCIRAAFKPTATISKQQETLNSQGEAVKLEAQGRHDPCVLPRAVPMVEAMVALVLCDHLLRQRALSGPPDDSRAGSAEEG